MRISRGCGLGLRRRGDHPLRRPMDTHVWRSCGNLSEEWVGGGTKPYDGNGNATHRAELVGSNVSSSRVPMRSSRGPSIREQLILHRHYAMQQALPRCVSSTFLFAIIPNALFSVGFGAALRILEVCIGQVGGCSTK